MTELTVAQPPTPEIKTQLYDLRAPNVGATNEELKVALAPIKKQLVEFTLLPTYQQDRPHAMFVASYHYTQDCTLPRGIVIGVLGSTPIFGPRTPGTEATGGPVNMHLLINDRTGMGESLYAIKGLIIEPDIVRRFNEAKKTKKLPRLGSTSPLHGISIGKYRREGETEDNYVIVVRANDTTAALHLMESIADQEEAPTVAEVAESDQYKALVASSQQYRDLLAKQTAEALGVEIDPKPLLSNALNSIVPVTTHSAGQPQQYNIYHDAHNTSEAHNGLLVSTGKLGGYMLLESSDPVTTKPQAWRNIHMSTYPTSTGKYDERVHKTAEVHDDAFASRVHYTVGLPGLIHSDATEKMAHRDDPFVTATAERLKESVEQKVVRTNVEFIAGVSPDAGYLQYGSIRDLQDVIQATGVKAIPVPINHPAVVQIAAQWPRLKSEYPKYTLSQAFASEYQVTDDGILTQYSLHPEADAKMRAVVPPTVETGPRPRFGRGYYQRRYYYGAYPYYGGYPYYYSGTGLGFLALALDAAIVRALVASK